MFHSRFVFTFYLTLPAQYPKICREEVSIHVIQSREHILNTVRENALENEGVIFTFGTVFRGYFKICRGTNSLLSAVLRLTNSIGEVSS